MLVDPQWDISITLKGPKLIKYMNADGNPVTERPTGSTGTGGAWLDMTTSDDDSDSEP